MGNLATLFTIRYLYDRFLHANVQDYMETEIHHLNHSILVKCPLAKRVIPRKLYDGLNHYLKIKNI